MNLQKTAIFAAILFVASIGVHSQSGGTFQMEKSVILSGGGPAAGGPFTLTGGIGEPIAGQSSGGGQFEVSSGFWASQASAPAPAQVTVSGRVLTADGRGLRNAIVSITNALGERRSTLTSSLGFYSFDNVAAGGTYLVSVNSKRFRFASRQMQISSDITNLDFNGLE